MIDDLHRDQLGREQDRARLVAVVALVAHMQRLGQQRSRSDPVCIVVPIDNNLLVLF